MVFLLAFSASSGIQRGVQRFAIKRTEAFVEEQRINARFMADQIR